MKKFLSRAWDMRRNYALAFALLIFYCAICMAQFFNAVEDQVEVRMEERVADVLEMQSDAIRGTLAVQFSTLKSAAHFAAQSTINSDELFCDENLRMLTSFKLHSYFSRTLLVNTSGIGYLNSGERIDVSESSYFHSVMKGADVLSQPLFSALVSGETDAGEKSVILAVPIWKDGQAIGLFGGSYDLAQVSNLLFSGVYDGHARSYIVDQYGQMICASGNTDVEEIVNILDTFAPDAQAISAQTLKDDFLHGRSGAFLCTHDFSQHTVAYRPLGLSSWMLVCAVPQEYVDIHYSFITQYEIVLFTAVFIGVSLFVIYAVALLRADRRLLSHQAKTDALSGLLNRAAAEEAIENLLRISGQVEGVMMLLDLDHFKDVNDSYGHQMGDRLIAQVGQTLLSTFRSTDYCCRLGGDEFLIFMRGSFAHEVVCERAQTLCDTLPTLLRDELSDVHWSLSVGVAYAPADGKTFGELYRSADKALYAAKNKGRSCYCFYEAS